MKIHYFKVTKEKYERNNNFAVVIRADENVDYGKIMALLDKFKAVGITKFWFGYRDYGR